MTNSFYCIDCQQNIEYTPTTGKALMNIMIAYSAHKEKCVDLSTNLTQDEQAKFFADRIIELANKMENESKK